MLLRPRSRHLMSSRYASVMSSSCSVFVFVLFSLYFIMCSLSSVGAVTFLITTCLSYFVPLYQVCFWDAAMVFIFRHCFFLLNGFYFNLDLPLLCYAPVFFFLIVFFLPNGFYVHLHLLSLCFVPVFFPARHCVPYT